MYLLLETGKLDLSWWYLTLVLVAVFSFACPNNVAELLIDELVGLGIRIWSGGKAKRRNMS
jgi:hypothetical protein